MGGFLFFMMLLVNGLIFCFVDIILDVVIFGINGINNGMLMLDKDWFDEGNVLSLLEVLL